MLFPDSELKILPYNRVIRDWNGHTAEEVLKTLESLGTLEKKDAPVQPEEKW